MNKNTKSLLSLENISVSFEGFLALNDLNLSLRKGELRAVIGPNGAGKTTFLDVITGKVKPTKGEVFFKGKSLIGRKEHKIARLGVGRKFQSPRVFENLTVKENLEISVSTPKSPLNLINKKIKNDQLDEIEHLIKVIKDDKNINTLCYCYESEEYNPGNPNTPSEQEYAAFLLTQCQVLNTINKKTNELYSAIDGIANPNVNMIPKKKDQRAVVIPNLRKNSTVYIPDNELL